MSFLNVEYEKREDRDLPREHASTVRIERVRGKMQEW